MHICHIITRLIIGGAQENTILSCEGLAQRGHRVTLISGPTRGPEGSLVARARGGGYAYLELPELIRECRQAAALPLRPADSLLIFCNPLMLPALPYLAMWLQEQLNEVWIYGGRSGGDSRATLAPDPASSRDE